MDGGEQTRLGRFFDRHPRLLRGLALIALLCGLGYLTWRVGWSGQGASPVPFGMLLATEIYGLWALGILTWFSWSRLEATSGRKVDVYVCTYDEPATSACAATDLRRRCQRPTRSSSPLTSTGRRPPARAWKPSRPPRSRPS